jgi:tRNA (cytidine/uridine-2'-O-)-methyltransferase
MAGNDAPRLRVPPPLEPFHIALVEPEIPQNTGSIARLCAATSSPLHLIGPLGFRIDEKAVRRAGLDYWHLVSVHQHADLARFGEVLPRSRWLLFSALAERSYLDASFEPGDALVFGKESVGLPEDVLRNHPRVFGIPTSGAVRSLNLSTCAGIVLYEALRATGNLAGATRKLAKYGLKIVVALVAVGGRRECGRLEHGVTRFDA